MNLGVVGFFVDHVIGDLLPAVVGVVMIYSIIEHLKVQLKDFILLFIESEGLFICCNLFRVTIVTNNLKLN